MPMMNYYGYGGYGLLGFLWMVLWWVIIVVAVVALVRWLSRGHGWCCHDRTSSALDVLKERYAKGDITKAQFEAMKKDIGE